MSAREALKKLVEEMPEDRLREVLNFAEFLNWQQDGAAWRAFGQAQLAGAYGPDEPEYGDADLKPGLNS
jgi:Protein of unknown function (DUF2281)